MTVHYKRLLVRRSLFSFSLFKNYSLAFQYYLSSSSSSSSSSQSFSFFLSSIKVTTHGRGRVKMSTIIRIFCRPFRLLQLSPITSVHIAASRRDAPLFLTPHCLLIFHAEEKCEDRFNGKQFEYHRQLLNTDTLALKPTYTTTEKKNK